MLCTTLKTSYSEGNGYMYLVPYHILKVVLFQSDYRYCSECHSISITCRRWAKDGFEKGEIRCDECGFYEQVPHVEEDRKRAYRNKLIDKILLSPNVELSDRKVLTKFKSTRDFEDDDEKTLQAMTRRVLRIRAPKLK